MHFSAKREELLSSIRKKDNEVLFKKRRLKAIQKLDEEKSEGQIDFTIEDVMNGTAFEAINKSKAEKLKIAIQEDNFVELLKMIRYFRKRLSFVKEDNLLCSQVRQLEVIPELVCILKKFQLVNDENRKIFEEASWTMANYCSGSPQSVELLTNQEFYDVAVEIFEKTTEIEVFQNVKKK